MKTSVHPAVSRSEHLRRPLANQMVQVLPRFGRWALEIREFETPYGKVGFRQLEILYRLRHNMFGNGDITPSQIAAHFDIQRSVVTRVLARLEQNAFIERVVNSKDGRQLSIKITDKGTQVSEIVEERFIQEMLAGLDFLDDDQIVELKRNVDVLTQVVTTLEANRHGC